MKKLLTLTTLLLLSVSSFGQNLEKDRLWRTKGVYDSLGNFVERAKIQSFLYSSSSNQLHRLSTKDRMNMKTGETTVFVYRDTLNLETIGNNSYKLSEKEYLTIHSKDSLTIHFNGFTLPYVKLNQKPNSVSVDKLKAGLLNQPFVESIDDKEEYQLTYQDTNLVKVKPLKSSSEWESDYKLIDFNGFMILQGIVSAPKLITNIDNGIIKFIQIDYRFENAKGKLARKK